MTDERSTGPWRRWLPIAVLAVVVTWSVRAIGDRDEAHTALVIATAVRPGDLQLVSSIDCVYCAAARRWLEQHGIAYTECLIERDAVCADTYRRAGAPGTPLVRVRDQWQVGFSPERVAQRLQAR